jgi:hypothetical protein
MPTLEIFWLSGNDNYAFKGEAGYANLLYVLSNHRKIELIRKLQKIFNKTVPFFTRNYGRI